MVFFRKRQRTSITGDLKPDPPVETKIIKKKTKLLSGIKTFISWFKRRGKVHSEASTDLQSRCVYVATIENDLMLEPVDDDESEEESSDDDDSWPFDEEHRHIGERNQTPDECSKLDNISFARELLRFHLEATLNRGRSGISNAKAHLGAHLQILRKYKSLYGVEKRQRRLELQRIRVDIERYRCRVARSDPVRRMFDNSDRLERQHMLKRSRRSERARREMLQTNIDQHRTRQYFEQRQRLRSNRSREVYLESAFGFPSRHADRITRRPRERYRQRTDNEREQVERSLLQEPKAFARQSVAQTQPPKRC